MRPATFGLVGLAVAMSLVPTAGAQPDDRSELFALMNAARADAGAPALQLDAAISESACAWNAGLAASGVLVHDRNLAAIGGAIAGWTKLGENLGLGPDTRSIFDALMASPTHRQNILDNAFNKVGICFGVAADGSLVTTDRFAAIPLDPLPPAVPLVEILPPDTAPPPPPPPPAPAQAPAPVAPAASATDPTPAEPAPLVTANPLIRPEVRIDGYLTSVDTGTRPGTLRVTNSFAEIWARTLALSEPSSPSCTCR